MMGPRLLVSERRSTLGAAALTATESTAVLVLAHVVAGGALPSVAWMATMWAAVLAFGALAGRRRLIGPAAGATVAMGLIALQLGLHCWLTVLTEAHAVHGGGGLGLTPLMVSTHVIAGLVAATSLALRRRAVDVALLWSSAPRSLFASRLPVATPAPSGVGRISTWRITPLRGPPLSIVS